MADRPCPETNRHPFAHSGNQTACPAVKPGMNHMNHSGIAGKTKTVWTYRELRGHGYSRRRIQALVKQGKLRKLLHGTYTKIQHPTGETVWEALNLVRRGVVLDGVSAIQAQESRPLSLPLSVRVPTKNTATSTPDLVRMTRSGRGHYEERGPYRAVPLADAIATCLDDGSMPEKRLREYANARYTGENGINRLDRELKVMTTRAKAKLRAFLESCIYGTDSGLEIRLVGALRRKGFKTQQNFKVGGYKWDVCIKELKVVIDVDSKKYHGDPLHQTFIIDRWKTNHAQLQGWTALRITEDCVGGLAGQHLVRLLEEIRDFRATKPRARLKGIVDYPVWGWHILLAAH